MPYIPLLRPVTNKDAIVLEKRAPELIRVPATGLEGLCLSNSLFKMPTHWNGALTVLCPEPKPCDLCDKVELRVYFLLGFCDRESRKAVWVQLTPGAGLSLLQQLEQLERPLHGATVRITRERKKLNSPVTVTVDKWAQCFSKLPLMDDPQETVARVFGANNCSRILSDGRVE